MQATKQKTPTSPENLVRIEAMALGFQDLLGNLYDRWQDEKDYEDINEYGDVIKGKLPEGFKLQEMTKRPFGFKFNLGTEAEYHLFISCNNMEWKRTA